LHDNTIAAAFGSAAGAVTVVGAAAGCAATKQPVKNRETAPSDKIAFIQK